MRLFTTGILVLVATLVACSGGDDNSDALGLEEYFTRLEAISDDAEAASDALDTRFDEDIANAAGEQEQLQIAARYVEDSANNSREAFDRLRALKPPDEVEDEHKEFVAAADAFSELFDDIIAQAREAASAEDLDSLSSDLDAPKYNDASDRLDAACFALQAVADEKGIEVDLRCGEDDEPIDDAPGEGTPDADTTELEDYFAEIDVIFEQADAALDEVGNDLDAALNTATNDAEQLEAFRESFQRSGETIESARSSLSEVEPPPEARDAIEAFLDATAGVLQLSSEVLDDLQDVTTVAEVDAYFNDRDAELAAASAAKDEACFDLQDVADEYGVDVDLECED